MNTGETDKRTGMSVALLLAILAFRVRITAEEREENHEGADSAQEGTNSLGGARNDVIHIDLLAPNICTPLLNNLRRES